MVNCVIPRLRRACCFPRQNCFPNLKCNSSKQAHRGDKHVAQYDSLNMHPGLYNNWENYLGEVIPILGSSVEVNRRGKLKVSHRGRSKVVSCAREENDGVTRRRSGGMCIGRFSRGRAKNGAAKGAQKSLRKGGGKEGGNFLDRAAAGRDSQSMGQRKGTHRTSVPSTAKGLEQMKNAYCSAVERNDHKLYVHKEEVENERNRNLSVETNINSNMYRRKSSGDGDVERDGRKSSSVANDSRSYTQRREREYEEEKKKQEEYIKKINLNDAKKNMLTKGIHSQNGKGKISSMSAKSRHIQEEGNYDFLINSNVVKKPEVGASKRVDEVSNNIFLRGNIYKIGNRSETREGRQTKKNKHGEPQIDKRKTPNCRVKKRKKTASGEPSRPEPFIGGTQRGSQQRDMHYQTSSGESSLYEISISGEVDINFDSDSCVGDTKSTRSGHSASGSKREAKRETKREYKGEARRETGPESVLSKKGTNREGGTTIENSEGITTREKRANQGKCSHLSGINGIQMRGNKNTNACEKGKILLNLKNMPPRKRENTGRLPFGVEPIGGFAHKVMNRNSERTTGTACCEKNCEPVQEMSNVSDGRGGGDTSRSLVGRSGQRGAASPLGGEIRSDVEEKRSGVEDKWKDSFRKNKPTAKMEEKREKKKKSSFLTTEDNATHRTHLHEASSRNSGRETTISNKRRSSDIRRKEFVEGLGDCSSDYDLKKCTSVLEYLLKLIKKEKVEMESCASCNELNQFHLKKKGDWINQGGGEERATQSYNVHIVGGKYEKERRNQLYSQLLHLEPELEDSTGTKLSLRVTTESNEERGNYNFVYPSSHKSGSNISTGNKFTKRGKKKDSSKGVRSRTVPKKDVSKGGAIQGKKERNASTCYSEEAEMKVKTQMDAEMATLTKLINLKSEQNEKLKMCLMMQESEINLLRKKAQEAHASKKQGKEKNWENTTFYKNLIKAKPSTFMEIILSNNQDVGNGTQMKETYESSVRAEKCNFAKSFNSCLCTICAVPGGRENGSFRLNDRSQCGAPCGGANAPIPDVETNFPTAAVQTDEFSPLESNLKYGENPYLQSCTFSGVPTGGICSYTCCMPSGNFKDLVIEDATSDESCSDQRHVSCCPPGGPAQNDVAGRDKTRGSSLHSNGYPSKGVSGMVGSRNKKDIVPKPKANAKKRLIKINGKGKFQTREKKYNAVAMGGEEPSRCASRGNFGTANYAQLNGKKGETQHGGYSRQRQNTSRTNSYKVEAKYPVTSSTISVRCLPKRKTAVAGSDRKSCFLSSRNANVAKEGDYQPKKESLFTKVFSYIRNNSFCNEKKNNNCVRRNKSTSSIVFVKNQDLSDRTYERSRSSGCLPDRTVSTVHKMNCINTPYVGAIPVCGNMCGNMSGGGGNLMTDEQKKIIRSGKQSQYGLNNTHGGRYHSNDGIVTNRICNDEVNKTVVEKGVIRSGCRYVLKGYGGTALGPDSHREIFKNKGKGQLVNDLHTKGKDPSFSNNMELQKGRNNNRVMTCEELSGMERPIIHNEMAISSDIIEKARLKYYASKRCAKCTDETGAGKQENKINPPVSFHKVGSNSGKKAKRHGGATKLGREIETNLNKRAHPTKRGNNGRGEMKNFGKNPSKGHPNRWPNGNKKSNKAEVLKKEDHSDGSASSDGSVASSASAGSGDSPNNSHKLWENNKSKKASETYKIFVLKKGNGDNCAVKREQGIHLRGHNGEGPKKGLQNVARTNGEANKNNVNYRENDRSVSADKRNYYTNVETTSDSVQTNTMDGYSTCSSEDIYLWERKKNRKARKKALNAEGIRRGKLNEQIGGGVNAQVVNSNGKLASSVAHVIEKIILNYKNWDMGGTKKGIGAASHSDDSDSDNSGYNDNGSNYHDDKRSGEAGTNCIKQSDLPDAHTCKKKKKKTSHFELNGERVKEQTISLKKPGSAYTALGRQCTNEDSHVNTNAQVKKKKSQDVNNVLCSSSQSSYPEPKIFFLKNDESCIIVEYPNVKYLVKCS
ncbi:hypothetical protein C922_03791 [Plasmodium inui San Antonio 1]|uniref:Uncharacterized protein n=1 Tax=Plasmodium inui San Antonio 1 TaxID=1237626 RepID=W7A392_9APIC|nr:hypothetical protein C922_03791 [Plasmodium inui San Antonio 1]EUD65808.1 hypothetical protein C922_03791 [Plasmodium inui San Antonio 1]